MPATKQDLPTRAHLLRSQIYAQEKKFATAHPKDREALAAEIDALVEDYAALEPEIEEEAEKRKAELLREWGALDTKRQALLRLLGHQVGAGEPVPKDQNGMARQMSDPRWPFTFAQKLPLVELEHYIGPEWNRLFGEAVKYGNSIQASIVYANKQVQKEYVPKSQRGDR